ncbi:DUF3558 domain-containing protein [Amycolatopsis sp. QT-25]|uniref:DUF3558 domain-containing protein n=1 Tax=Amycolatopsis sp. QT-25 TaxID=3034022 RepID=UPI0023EC9FA7|nr:DUF3558 domain-containing protein [Amycolatopsis sp. QT-25]WET79536.1 DUF3558 domain-containing protein [Amycolatopsis sp. QT-25]
MRRRTQFLSVAITAVVVLAGGCSDQKPGTPTPVPSPTPPSAQLPRDGAPAVTDPIKNTSGAETDPCSAVKTAQVEEFGGKVEKTVTDNGGLGKNCGWIFEEGPSNVNAGMVVGNKEGLSSLYAKNAHGDFATFKPVDPIEGYPAVIYGTTGGREGFCNLAVGLRDDLVYTVVPQLYSGNPMVNDPCGLATKVAAAAIKNLKGA